MFVKWATGSVLLLKRTKFTCLAKKHNTLEQWCYRLQTQGPDTDKTDAYSHKTKLLTSLFIRPGKVMVGS